MESKKKIKICFLADKHNLFDDRIYWKMAVPLKERGYEVHYLLIRNKNEKGITSEGIHYQILKIKTFSSNRYLNFILKNLNPNNNYKKLFKRAKELEADIYHFHDLWINKIGVKLKRLKHKPVVFYDAREPYSDDYKSYTKAIGLLKKVVELFAYLVDRWEKLKSKNYDLVISNEEIVRDNFRTKIGVEKAEVLYNFTDNYKLFRGVSLENKKYDFIYSGSITELRGALKVLQATLLAKRMLPNIKVVFVGIYESQRLKNEMNSFIEKNNLRNNIELHPFIDYSQISKYYNNAKVGFITPFPEPSFKIKMYIKIFEYMAFGLPIIGSDFGHIKKYVENENCGLLVDPLSESEISKAMVKLIQDKELYAELSKNGRKATLERYKWDFELEKLVNYYSKALKKRNS